MIGCHTKKHEKSKTEFSGEENFALQPGSVLGEEFKAEDFNRVREWILNTLLPVASGKNKDKLNEIVKYLDDVEKSPDVYFDDMNNLVEFIQIMTQCSIIATEIKPDNFYINYNLAYNYLTTASSIENFLDPSEEHKRLSDEYKQKALQAAKDLVKKFPDEAKAYHQLGFFTAIVEDDDQKALELYKRCLEIDPKLEMCRKAYYATREDLEN
jgi:tetratricopeptide (TPR) repeat protein